MQFSIIIPVKNEELHIDRCLDSLLNLDWDSSEYEVIVIDNGSTDRTVAVARERVSQVFIQPALTIAAMRNFGARMAHGEILAFIDADCTVQDDWLRQASRYLHRKEIICFGSPPVVPQGATWVQKAWFLVRRKNQDGDASWLESMNMFVRRDTFLTAGGFNENLVTCEDYDLSLRLKRVGSLVTDTRLVAVHHGEAASLRHFFRKEYWRGTGNLHGIRSHGISWQELPSIALPLAYGVLALLVTGIIMAALLTDYTLLPTMAFVVSLAWQVPILGLALWKNGLHRTLLSTLQLYLLLNLYFIARGFTLVHRNSR